MAAYYNEIDPYAAQWLRNLIAAGHIAPGDVDERSIKDVRPDDLKNYNQCHFFAGVGVWSYALRLAGWPDDRPVWTGSCPCQPFSAAGKQQGTADERHLWPAWFNLINQCNPPVVFGEQVEAAIRHGWLDLVQSDMEGIGYAFAAAGIPAAGFGAPHIRQRLWFVADADGRNAGTEGIQRGGKHGQQSQDSGTGVLGRPGSEGLEGLGSRHQAESGRDGAVRPVAAAGESGGVGDAISGGRQSQPSIIREHGKGMEPGRRQQVASVEAGGDVSGELADTFGGQLSETGRRQIGRVGQSGVGQECGRPGPTNGRWRDADWLHCRDGKWRPVEPGTFPLAHGAAARVGRLRAYGNAIVPQVAAEVISAYMLG